MWQPKIKKRRRISDVGLSLIKNFEGCKLRAYVCPSGVTTIGYGHTKTAKTGQIITKEKAEKLLREDLSWAEKAVESYVKVEITQLQFDALVSFVFNVGASAFKNSTLLRCVNAGENENAALQFLRWIYANRTVLVGLENRRKAEKLLWEGELPEWLKKSGERSSLV